MASFLVLLKVFFFYFWPYGKRPFRDYFLFFPGFLSKSKVPCFVFLLLFVALLSCALILGLDNLDIWPVVELQQCFLEVL